jgi:putative methyltransferase (TIGR04325 family)
MSLLTEAKLYARTSVPVLRNVLDRRYFQNFLSEAGFGSYYGIYSSFSEAKRHIPESDGYNQEALAEEFMARIDCVFPYDYPILFWLYRAFQAGCKSVFDIGGSVGIHYYAYQKYLVYPDDIKWCVCETPAMARVGGQLAATNGVGNLTFVESVNSAASHADIWYSAGALQYMEKSHPKQLLEVSGSRPTHILLNKIPVYDGDEFVTSQNIGKDSYSPFQVFNRKKMIAEFEELGYQLMDSWAVMERRLHLTGHPERSLPTFSGMYFRTR